MRWISIIAAICFLASCGTNQPTSTTQLAADKGTREGKSYFKIYKDAQGQTIHEIKNHRFETHTAMLTDVPNELIMESITTKKQFPGYDSCATGQLKLNFYKTLEDSLVLFRAYSTAADHFGFISNSRDIFKTVMEPCGGNGIAGHLYSLYSAKPIITFHDYYNEITLPQTDIVRYAAFHPVVSNIPFTVKEQDEQLVGILHYGSKRGSKVRVRITVEDHQLLEIAREHPPQLFVLAKRSGNIIRRKDMEVYPDKGEDFYTVPTNFSLEVNFTHEDRLPSIVIPVENDELKVDKAGGGPYKLEKLD